MESSTKINISQFLGEKGGTEFMNDENLEILSIFYPKYLITTMKVQRYRACLG